MPQERRCRLPSGRSRCLRAAPSESVAGAKTRTDSERSDAVLVPVAAQIVLKRDDREVNGRRLHDIKNQMN
jgi:hypothetical protein